MKLLLIDVHDKESNIQSKYYALGFGYLISYLKDEIKKKLEIKIISTNIFRTIDEFQPNIVGLSCVSQNYNKAKEIAAYCKIKNIIVIVGKSHVSALPMSLDKNMDVGVIGEGEQTFQELMQLFLDNKFNTKELAKIEGIVYRDGNTLIQTKPRSLIKNLDSIPIPDRSLFELKRGDSIYMFSSRGCPYNCKFCFSSRFWDSVRFHSAEYVINEINYLYKHYKPLRITFCDDLFVADKNRLKKIVSLIKKQKYYRKIKFTISARANLINKDIAELLKEMGVDIVTMGLESGSNRILNYLKGPTITVEQSINAINILKEKNFQVSASFIIGSPDETKEEILKTFNFIKNSKLDLFEIGLLTPLPGTPIWDYAKERGLVSEDSNMNFNRLNIDFIENYQDFIILSEKFNKEELRDFYILFIKERKKRYIILMFKYIYRRPREIIRYLIYKLLLKIN